MNIVFSDVLYFIPSQSTEWGKYDERLMKAAENGDTEKLIATLKKGTNPTKLDPEGHSA